MSLRTFNGIAASPGHVRANALKVDNPMVAPERPAGDFIVVAEFTTPALNVLLMDAKGIACETGGVTMHAAVIARELGIPCVVGVTGIMDAVMSRQIITVNGDTGEVYVG